LAIALPILLSLGLVSEEFGRLFYQTTRLSNGTRLAARYLTTAPFTTTTKRDAAYAEAKTGGLRSHIIVRRNGDSSGLTTANVSITTAGGVLASIPETVTSRLLVSLFSRQSISRATQKARLDACSTTRT
jgi:Flp pilus assembly protein TadG